MRPGVILVHQHCCVRRLHAMVMPGIVGIAVNISNGLLMLNYYCCKG